MSVDFSGLSRLTNDSLKEFFTRNKDSLKIVRMNLLDQIEVNDNVCEGLFNCGMLEELHMTGCRNLTDFGIKNLFDNDKLNEIIVQSQMGGF